MHEDEQKLDDVHPDQTFRTATGEEIKNLKQLVHVLQDISPESFAHHVTDEKNDFGSWIRHSVKDDELAEMVEKTTDFDKTKQIINDRIELLEKKIEVRKIKDSLEELKTDEMGIDEPEDPVAPDTLGNEEPEIDVPLKEEETSADSLAPAEPPEAFITKEDHPFEHLKKGMHLTIRDVLVGVVIGILIGYILATYL